MITQDLGIATAYGYAKSKGYTGTEAEFAELMASYATVGQTAVTAAQTATTKASEAATSATTATNKATEATTAATTATTKAGEASTSASTATSAKDTAVSAASTATTKATEATTAAATATSAATTATTAKDDAVSAKTAAQTAQTAAETAQEAAEDAAESVSASAAQIATNTADISDIKEDLTQKANQDGYYADLVSGGSTQLLSDMVETDTTPYNYRTAGGSLEIGDREKLKKIVGGSLAVNQLVRNGDFSNGSDRWSLYMITAAFDNNIATVVTADTVNVNSGGSLIQTGITVFANHKYIVSATIKGDGEHRTALRADGGFSFNAIVNVSNDFKTFEGIAVGVSDPSSGRVVITAYGPSMTILVKNVKLFDLTAMFGPTIADYVYSLETATAGAGVAWLKARFPKVFDAGYIPYNAGTLEHVSGLSAHKMTGFNQWDEEWEVGAYNSSSGEKTDNVTDRIRSKNFIPVLPSTTYYKNKGLQVYWYDADHNFIGWNSMINPGTLTSPSNCHYMTFNCLANSGTTYNHDICINLHWDGERDGKYEPYEEHSYPLDSDVTLRGIYKLDANNQLYADGDEYAPDGTVTRRYGIVDLGTLDWTKSTNYANPIFYASISDIISGVQDKKLVCSKYVYVVGLSAGTVADYTTPVIGTSAPNKQVIVRDPNYDSSDAATFKTAMSGVMLVYELATPTTEEGTPYTEIQNVSNWGTEEFVSESLVSVGHETEYQPDLRAKIEVAPESPDADGLYLMKRENGQNSYVAYLGELPSDPTTDGTYTLKCTVSGGTATKTWEADT